MRAGIMKSAHGEWTGYVEGTQRGYAYGVKRNGIRYTERYVHVTADRGVEEAYRSASRGAAALHSTAQRRPDLLGEPMFCQECGQPHSVCLCGRPSSPPRGLLGG